MASILQVEQIQGPTSGANANTITIPSGQTINVNGTLSGDGSNLTNLSSSNLSGALPALDGSALTGVGKVLQVQQVRMTTDIRISTNYASPVDLITASITPSSTSSKILVMGNLASVARRQNGNSEGFFYLVRNGSSLGTFDGITPWNDSATNQRSVGSIHVQYLDSPSSTSAVTYILRAYRDGSGSIDINDEGGISSITLMEIGG